MDGPDGRMADAVYKFCLVAEEFAAPPEVLLFKLLIPLFCMMCVIFSKRILFSRSISVYLSIHSDLRYDTCIAYLRAFGFS